MNRNNNTTIGLDIAKNVFHYAELNRNGRVTGSGMLKRNKVLSHFAGLEPSKVVMESFPLAQFFVSTGKILTSKFRNFYHSRPFQLFW